MFLSSLYCRTSVSAIAILACAGAAEAQSNPEIDALQRQIEALQQQLDRLQNEVSKQREVGPAPAAGSLESGNDKITLELSGQVNRGILLTDDSEQTDVFFVDNDNSSTRFRLVGEARASDEFKVGTNIEVQFESNSTAAVNQDNERNVGPNNFTERKLELYFDSASLGRLSIGQGDTASNSTSEVDLSGTGVVGYSGVADLAGGLLFRDGDDVSNISIGSSFSNLDGLSRDDRVRYDTPSFGGLTVSGSLIADERWDVAAVYGREFSGIKVGGGLAYSEVPDAFEQINGSASVLFASGISLTVAAGRRDFDARGGDGNFYYGKIGYQKRFFDIGKTALAIDYYRGEDIGADSDEADSSSVLIVQKLEPFATELYAGYRRYELDRDGFDLNAIDALLTGARVKF